MHNVTTYVARGAGVLALSVLSLCARPALAGPTDVRDVDQPARNPYVMATTTLNNAGGVQVVGAVPAGYRFVIEFVSGNCGGTGGVSPTTLRLSAYGNADHYFAPVLYQGGTVAVISQPTRIYAVPKNNVGLTIFPTTASPTVYCNVTLSGHLVEL